MTDPSFQKNRSNRFRLYYTATLLALCCYDSYISVYLEQSLGLSGSQIGLFLSTSMIAGLVIMPLYGALGDRTGRYREILMLCTAGCILFAFLLSMQTGFILLTIMGIGFELNRCSILAMADTQTIRYCSVSGRPYGSIRCFGCVGWICGSLLCTFLVKQFGLEHIFFRLFMAAMSASFLIVCIFPRLPSSEAEREAGSPDKKVLKGSLRVLFTIRPYLFLVLFALLTGALNEVVTTYASLHLVSTLHGAPYLVSIYSLFGAVPEILFLLLLNRFLLPRLGFRGLFLISAGAMTIRMLLFAGVHSIGLFFGACCLTFLTSACTTGLNMQYIQKSVPAAVLGAAAAVYNAVFMGGRALFSLLFGSVYEYFGSRMVFAICAVCAALAFLGALKFTSNVKKEELQDETCSS